MSVIQKMLDNKTPFSVIQYFENLKKSNNETHKQYEIVYLNSKKIISFKIINEIEKNVFKNNIKQFSLVVNDKSGSVYEFEKFKQYKEENECFEIKNFNKN